MDNDKYIGKLLDDRYEILEVIGNGGMAVVYKARCRRLNRMVAIKILKDEFSQDGDFRNRFHAESQAVAMLSHPNIVAVYDVSSTGDSEYIVMELIEGITLKYYMEKKGVLNWKETLHFAMQIAKALEHAHSRGIVHRDIKPHNVMVLKNGSVKVADFGIAQIMSTGNTMTQEALGSVHYISPEQAKGGRVDSRSDVYSLGVVMYEMISGRVPYDGDTPVSVVMKHINGGAPLPTSLNPNTPRGLEQIIMKAMAQQQKDRYATATAMLYDMDEFRKNPVMVFPDSKAQEKDVQPASESEKPEKTPQTIARKKVQPSRKEVESRNRVATIAIASCALAGLVAIVILLLLIPSCQKGPAQVTVPDLIGKDVKELAAYTDIQVLIQEEYSDEYPAGQVFDQYPAAGELVEKGYKVSVSVSLGSRAKYMMDLTGAELKDARKQLNDLELGLKIQVQSEKSNKIPEGCVIRTEPAQGTTLKIGQTVILYCNMAQSAQVPDVLGNMVEEAIAALEDAGFTKHRVIEIENDLPKGTVIELSVDVLSNISTDREIVLYVSRGQTILEDLTGKTAEEVEQYLESLNLKLTISYDQENNSQIQPGCVVRTDPVAGTVLTKEMELKIYFSAGPGMAIMPDLRGKSLEEAKAALAALDITNLREKEVSSLLSAGQVVETSVNPGVQVDISKQVVIFVSKGDKGLADLSGKTVEEAEVYFASLDLNLTVVTEPIRNNDVEQGGVVGTNPPEGSTVDYGQTITVYYSSGPSSGAVPDVEGDRLADAIKKLNAAGFYNLEVQEIDGDREPGHVLALSVSAGEWVDVNTNIIIHVAKGEATTEVTLSNYAFELPGRDETVLLTITCNGVTVLSQNVAPSANKVYVTITGNGTQQYDLYIDGIYCRTETVVFDPDD